MRNHTHPQSLLVVVLLPPRSLQLLMLHRLLLLLRRLPAVGIVLSAALGTTHSSGCRCALAQ
jgi:hypothetical protein